MVAHERSESSRGQEDVTPDDPLKEAVMGLWYNASVPKPNIKVVFVQTTLILIADCSRHPYGILRPLLNPAADVVGGVDIYGEPQRLRIPEGALVAVIHPTLFGVVICCRHIAGDGCYLHELGVRGLALVMPLQGTNCVNRCYLAQGAR